ncbi:hypothetical protein P5673_014798 [Acropora cervicornis]|uniref:Uncharacterized protein n=1 Tax=Acropora cervicornis TaxID=6130 RepID=A0AAD9QJ04_ACRCE|nr:hypothetical protein P5673_014798 [Acropora cervicornis]
MVFTRRTYHCRPRSPASSLQLPADAHHQKIHDLISYAIPNKHINCLSPIAWTTLFPRKP